MVSNIFFCYLAPFLVLLLSCLFLVCSSSWKKRCISPHKKKKKTRKEYKRKFIILFNSLFNFILIYYHTILSIPIQKVLFSKKVPLDATPPKKQKKEYIGLCIVLAVRQQTEMGFLLIKDVLGR